MNPSDDADWTWRSDEVEGGVAESVAEWLQGANERSSIRHAVASLLEENVRLRAVLGRCPRGIAVLDAAGNVVGFNRELRSLLQADVVLAEPLERFFDPADREILVEVVRCAGEDKRSAGVLRTTGEDGREIEFFAATLPDEHGNAVGVVLAGEDRTARLRDDTDRALVDEANVVSAFQLAGAMLRHELGSALGVAHQALAEGKADTAAEALRHAEAILVRRTTVPPLPQPTSREWSNVAEAARRAARFALVGQARRRAMVQVSVDERLHVGVADRHLTQVLANLVSNSLHAVLGQPELGIIRIEAEPRDDDRLTLRVRDNGVGIEPARLQTVFDPGETTRPGAPGLGLAIARLLVESAGGAMRVQSEPGEGTVVVFDLPIRLD